MTHEALLNLCAQLSAENVQLRETIRIHEDTIQKLEMMPCEPCECEIISAK